MERKRILKAYGAEIVLTDPGEGSDGAIRKCREIYAADPDRLFLSRSVQQSGQLEGALRQYRARDYRTDRRRVTHFVSAMGTSGTFMGVTRRLQRDLPGVKCYSAQPSSGFHGLEGLKHMPTAIVPGIYDDTLADGNVWLETEDAYAHGAALAQRRGAAGGHLVGRQRGGGATTGPGPGGARERPA